MSPFSLLLLLLSIVPFVWRKRHVLYVLKKVIFTHVEAYLRFIWHCFFVPLGHVDQSVRLQKFYEGQADVYDTTRNGLLHGRESMLSLSAAHIRVMRSKFPTTRLVWVDIGGGTGFNIEQMDEYMPLSTFDHIYLVDLCEPLLKVARERFEKRGYKNITLLCQDASSFRLPEWEEGVDPKGSLGFVTLSYSLSMIPNFYLLLDRINHLLSPTLGLFGVVDFYASTAQMSSHERAIGGTQKQCSWFTRWFWQIWFDFDHVSLSPQRRDYLEYKFGTIKNYNGRNNFIVPFLVRIPYYIWLGRSRACNVSTFHHAFSVEGGNKITDGSPTLDANIPPPYEALETIPPLQIEEAALTLAIGPQEQERNEFNKITPPLSSFHYQLNFPWRLPYYDSPVHKEFRTFVYSFTWEDPEEDMRHLDLNQKDSMFVITSAGDNALHYAINANPKRIHCVDVNPCQGHLFELKLASILTLDYTDLFSLFGRGQHPSFRTLLDSKLAPHLSSTAYQFWRLNQTAFQKSFYLNGYSGWALRLARYIFKFAGISSDIQQLCRADSIEEQERVWREKVRPVLLNWVVVALLKNPVFCWNALGVPMNQRRIFLREGSAWEFIRDTMEPLARHKLFSKGAYFYLLTLLGHYEPDSCPDYLKRSSYDALRANEGEMMKSFRLHTDSIINVLRGLPSSSLTKAVLMDHLDWFNQDGIEATEELRELYRAIAPGGKVLWRSAAKYPWYNKCFEDVGFTLRVVGMREGPTRAIDRVNMYASCWMGEKLEVAGSP